MLSYKKPDSHINVKVEFGEGEGKVPLKAISEKAEAYKPKEGVTYKMIKEYHRSKIRLQSTYRLYRRGKERFRLADVRRSQCGGRIETAQETSDSGESGSDKGRFEVF